MTKVTLNNLGTGTPFQTAVPTINNNNDTIETAFDNTLSRDGSTPNQMAAPIDMNSQRVLNLPDAISNQEPITLNQASILKGGGTINVTLPTGGTTNQVLKKNTNTNYDVSWGTPTGTVTSVGLSMPSEFNVSGSPVTVTGTLTATLAASPTGTGSLVKATSPTITTPTINSPVLTSPTLGSPASGNLVACTGYLTSNLSGSGTGVNNFLTTPSSANLAAAVTDETGTGSLVFGTAPVLNAPVISSITNTGTITLPTSTTTLIGDSSTATLTNKTFASNGTGNALSLEGITLSGVNNVSHWRTRATGVNFNSANSDTQITLPMPAGFSKWQVYAFYITNASGTLTTSTFGIFSAAGGGGTTIQAATACTVNTSANNSATNTQGAFGAIGQGTYNFNPIFFRVITPQGVAATADVVIIYIPLA